MSPFPSRLSTLLIPLICLALLSAALCGCHDRAPAAAESTDGAVITDALGRRVPVGAYGRVAAGSGSLAHIWVLAGGSLAGVTDDAFDGRFELPQDVQNIGKLNQISLEKLIALDPDLVILSSEIASQVKLLEGLEAAGIRGVCLSVESFGDYLAVLKDFTDITGREDLREQNGLALKARVDGALEKAKGAGAPKILLLRANSGKTQARNSDSLAGAMLRDMGCVNIADSRNGLLENLSMETVIKEDPDYIFAVLQGAEEEKARKSLNEALTGDPAWASLRAVESGRFLILPKDLFHEKPNDRWPEAYEMLLEILYGKG
jgi:iron complex transport system substrate-binding protein